MDILIITAQLILSLSILIVLHELGHFIPAKLFKTRVEKFYLFFNPWFSIFKVKKGETEYGLGWLPLGGYVKISGMIDESMDKEQMKQPPKPWEFRSKPAWQRLIIMVGGVTVNLILGFLIYIMVLFAWGKEYLPVENVKYGIAADSTMKHYGLQDGDMIVAVGGEKPQDINEVNRKILIRGKRTVTVLRDGQEKEITFPPDFEQELLESETKALFVERIPFIVEDVKEDFPAAKTDLQKGDTIVGINSLSTPWFHDFYQNIRNFAGKEVTIKVKRGEDLLTMPVSVTKEGQIGVQPVHPMNLFETETITYSFAEAIPAGVREAYITLSGYVESLKLIFTPAGAKQIGGFGTIAKLFPSEWSWPIFWRVTAFLSLILAFMNILPIPALDGGHVMFLLYEIIARRKPGEKFMEYAQIAGLILLVALLIFANGNDLIKSLGS